MSRYRLERLSVISRRTHGREALVAAYDYARIETEAKPHVRTMHGHGLPTDGSYSPRTMAERNQYGEDLARFAPDQPSRIDTVLSWMSASAHQPSARQVLQNAEARARQIDKAAAFLVSNQAARARAQTTAEVAFAAVDDPGFRSFDEFIETVIAEVKEMPTQFAYLFHEVTAPAHGDNGLA